jgi:hypothetical protein
VKYIPEWFPGAEFKRFAREGQAIGRRVRDDPIAIVKADIVSLLFCRFLYVAPLNCVGYLLG